MDDPKLHIAHNNFVQFFLGHLDLARELVEAYLPLPVLKEIDLGSLKREHGSFVDSRLRDKHSDILFSVRLHLSSPNETDEALVYLLLEHKSEADRLTVFQLLTYVVQICEQRIRWGKKLCPIFPLVLYHGAREWSAPRSFEELLGASPELSKHQLRFSFSLLDLSEKSDEDIRAQRVLRAALLLLKYGRSRRLLHELVTILGLLRSAQLPDPASWSTAIRTYVMSVNENIDWNDLDYIVDHVLPQQMIPNSIADRLIKKGREEGRTEGKAEGKVEGKAEGSAEGIKRGRIIGQIQLLCELLSEPSPREEVLFSQSLVELTAKLEQLRSRF